MPRLSTADIEVATARGPGAGRFLAAALLDALDGGAVLMAIGEAPSQPRPAVRGVDFHFTSDSPDTDELIRVGLDDRGRVLTAQLLRVAKQGEGPPCDPGSLVQALRQGSSVTQMRWCANDGPERERALELVVTGDREIRVAITQA